MLTLGRVMTQERFQQVYHKEKPKVSITLEIFQLV